jgi:hypothetical protein
MITKLQVRWLTTFAVTFLIACGYLMFLLAVIDRLTLTILGVQSRIVGVLFIGGGIVMLAESIRCARALRRLTIHHPQRTHDAPWALVCPFMALFILMSFPNFLNDALGSIGPFAKLVVLWFVPMSELAFIAAGAQVDAEDQNKRVNFTVLGFLHNLGGGFGILFARRVFQDSKVFDRAPAGVPYLVIWIVIGFYIFDGPKSNMFPLIMPGITQTPINPTTK